MTDYDKEVVIDIGGGSGKYLVERSLNEPQKTFLVLELKPVKPEKIPENLHIIQWMSSQKSGIPLGKQTIDEANIHFLFGEIKGESGVTIDSNDLSAEVSAYRNLLVNLKNVLKERARVNILEVKDNAPRVEHLLKEEGFQIITPARRLGNEDQTAWSTVFFRTFRISGRSESESHVLPMEIEANWLPE